MCLCTHLRSIFSTLGLHLRCFHTGIKQNLTPLDLIGTVIEIVDSTNVFVHLFYCHFPFISTISTWSWSFQRLFYFFRHLKLYKLSMFTPNILIAWSRLLDLEHTILTSLYFAWLWFNSIRFNSVFDLGSFSVRHICSAIAYFLRYRLEIFSNSVLRRAHTQVSVVIHQSSAETIQCLIINQIKNFSITKTIMENEWSAA